METAKKIIQLEKIIHDHEDRISKLENLSNKTTNGFLIKDNEKLENRVSKFLKEIEIDHKKLNKIFDLTEDDLNLKIPIDGNYKEQQIKATLVILTGYHFLFEKNKMKAQDLKDKLKRLGVRSLTNLSENLKEKEIINYFNRKGKSRSQSFEYEITIPGINRGIEIIKDLSENIP